MSRRWLAPLVPLYAAGLAWRNRRIENGSKPIRRLRFPVISIGNLSTGGSGKTPLTITLAKALHQRGLQVDVLSRGYGRQSRLPARVDPNGHAEDFGDEPLLIARETGLPVYVAPDRYDAGLLAETENSADSGVRVHLLDDGFQHRQLFRSVDIVLLNRHDWQDNLLPAGNLREPLKSIRRATILATPAGDPALEMDLKTWGWQGQIWRLKRTMDVPAIDGAVVAFCGIARPDQFFQGLESAGLALAIRKAFPDHHRYTIADLTQLKASSAAAGATALITTEKDFVRLGKLTAAFPELVPLKTARLHIEIENESDAIDWLAARIAPGRPYPPL